MRTQAHPKSDVACVRSSLPCGCISVAVAGAGAVSIVHLVTGLSGLSCCENLTDMSFRLLLPFFILFIFIFYLNLRIFEVKLACRILPCPFWLRSSETAGVIYTRLHARGPLCGCLILLPKRHFYYVDTG